MNRATFALALGVVLAVGGLASAIVVLRKNVDRPSKALVDAYADYSQCMFGGPLDGPSPCRRIGDIAWSLPEEQTDWPARCEIYASRVQKLGFDQKTKLVDSLIHPRTRSEARTCASSGDRAAKLDAHLRGGKVTDEVRAPSPLLPRFDPTGKPSIDTELYTVSAYPNEHVQWGVTARHYDSEEHETTETRIVYGGVGGVLTPPPLVPTFHGGNPYLYGNAPPPFSDKHGIALRTERGFVFVPAELGKARAVVWSDPNGAITRTEPLPYASERVLRLFPNGILVQTSQHQFGTVAFTTPHDVEPLVFDNAEHLELVGSCSNGKIGAALLDSVQGARLVATDGTGFSARTVDPRPSQGALLAGCLRDRVVSVTPPPRRVLSCGFRDDCIELGQIDSGLNAYERSSFALVGESLLEVRQGFSVRFRIGSPRDLNHKPFHVLGDAGGDGGGLYVFIASDPARAKAMLFLHYGPRTSPSNRLLAAEVDEKGELTLAKLAPLPVPPKRDHRRSLP